MWTGRGGPRPGAGRPRGPRPRVLHRRREPVPGDCPVHVTLRMRAGIPSLRGGALVREFRRSLAEASERGHFRVVHYSLQHDHAHLVIEAKGKDALARGMKSIAARLARAVNRVCSSKRRRARFPLSPPRPANAPRGAPGAGLCAAQRTPASREAAWYLARHGRPLRRCELCALVQRLAAALRGTAHCHGVRPRGGEASHVAAPHRLEAPWPGRSVRGARDLLQADATGWLAGDPRGGAFRTRPEPCCRPSAPLRPIDSPHPSSPQPPPSGWQREGSSAAKRAVSRRERSHDSWLSAPRNSRGA